MAPYSDCHGRKALLKFYSLEEILAEKLRSLLTRTEPRDLYDAHYILTNQMVDVVNMTWVHLPNCEVKHLSTHG
ncbi:MAG: nucleotidyl transferase AbiEii/AbiGii toxin family protein [Anaerolineales bacterium]|jgi:predicted nucleotidyltransferase component of viral defense system